MQHTIVIPTFQTIEVKLPLYFRKEYHIYAITDDNRAVCASWWPALNEGSIITTDADSAMRSYTPGSEVTAEEFEAQAERAMQYITAAVEAAKSITA